jgi:hypothetical protein
MPLRNLSCFQEINVIKFSEEYILEKPIQVFYRSPSYIGEHIEYNEPLFTIDDIRDKFSDVMERWLKVSDELDSVCNLFFSVQYAAGMYAQHGFSISFKPQKRITGSGAITRSSQKANTKSVGKRYSPPS